MKYYKIYLIAICSFALINLNAQVFVGGSAGLNISSDESKATSPTSNTSDYSIGLFPSLGKFLSEKFAIGLALDISFSGSKRDVNPEIITKTSSIGISPFVRYYAKRWNKFSVYGQGKTGLTFSDSNVKYGGITNDGPKQTRIYLNISPGLAYDISEKLSLETSLNFLNLRYSYGTTKDGPLKNTASAFTIGTGLNNIVSLNAITIGAIYKF